MRVKRFFAIILGVIVILMISALLILLVNSPGKTPQLTDTEGQPISSSINEKKSMSIGGVQQGMFIRGEDKTKPVLLFLHGGPGTPEFAMSHAWETQDRLEKEFVVCYWDQRGTGMSNPKGLKKETLTTSNLIQDTVEVTKYLQKRFDKQQIFLMGHSFGSYIGLKTAQKYPENYVAYLGVGQVIHQKEGQKRAYQYLRDQAKEKNDQKALKKLATFDPEAPAYNMLLEEYGVGIRHDGPATMKLLKNLLFFKGYTSKEKWQAIQGMAISNQQLDTPDYSEDNLVKTVPKVDVPVYFLHGKYDYQVSYELAKEFYERVDAPKKGFYTFENSAHSPNMEEPAVFMKAVKEVVEIVDHQGGR
ncbi:alpha/beta fold hydrolase [Enterococcus sp. AZ072]|uniref:alpha/beta fold hydrolase n=1 Tax=unclassified Enterococcus TaxID=2608891 RepID=UPI003D26E384